jgi:hypothetical protein
LVRAVLVRMRALVRENPDKSKICELASKLLNAQCLTGGNGVASRVKSEFV